MSDISAQKPAGDRRQGAVAGIEPALATAVEKVPSGGRWILSLAADILTRPDAILRTTEA